MRQSGEGSIDRRIIVLLVLMNVLIQIMLLFSQALLTLPAVSYTHLDVYKRQVGSN